MFKILVIDDDVDLLFLGSSLLRQKGFDVFSFEWWHFDYKDWRHYPILNLTFDQIAPAAHVPVGARFIAPIREITR